MTHRAERWEGVAGTPFQGAFVVAVPVTEARVLLKGAAVLASPPSFVTLCGGSGKMCYRLRIPVIIK